MDRLLEIRDLRIEARAQDGWREIVKGVDLTVARGEIVGLIGESGAGKSTLGLAAMGHVKPGLRIAGGSIRFDGQELIGARESALRDLRGRRIAYVAQSSAAAFNPAWRSGDRCGRGDDPPRGRRPGRTDCGPRACAVGPGMIFPSNRVRIMVATKPIARHRTRINGASMARSARATTAWRRW